MEKIAYKNENYVLQDLLMEACAVARDASEAILDIAASGALGAASKSDQSIVTLADVAAEEIVMAGLQKLTPNIPILSEEQVEAGNIPDLTGGTYWTIDPLDGTQDFVEGRNGYAVLIGLVHEEKPVLGVIYQPSKSKLYAASVPDKLAFMQDDNYQDRADLNAQDHTDAHGVVRTIVNYGSGDIEKVFNFLEGHRSKSTDHSSAANLFKINKKDMLSMRDRGDNYVFCPVAEGKAELYAHVSRSKGDGAPFWDVVPGHALIAATGGRMVDFDGEEITYKQRKQQNKMALRTAPYVAIAGHQHRRGQQQPKSKRFKP